MAFERRLNVGWMLSGGVAEPFPIGQGRPVMAALREAHLPTDGAHGRTWHYTTSFETPLEADERVYLRFEQVWGQASVAVNGQSAGNVTTGEGIVDVTALLAPEDNQLTLTFDPAPEAKWLGLWGDVYIITANGLFVTHLTVNRSAVELTLQVRTPGRYDFQYTANADGALTLRQCFTQMLDVGEAHTRHALDVNAPVSEPLNVRLNVVHNGVGCAQVDFALPSNGDDLPPRRALVYHGAPVPPETVAAMAEVGAQAIFAPDEPTRRVDVPLIGPLPRLDKVSPFDADSHGSDELAEFKQASDMLRHALLCRQRGQLAAFHWNGSGALVNDDGSPRMAHDTIKRAWGSWCVWVDAPERVQPGSDVLVDVWVQVDGSAVGDVHVSMCAYDSDGNQIAQGQGQYTGQGKGVAALWPFTAPNDSVIILRTHMRDDAGHEASMDQVVPVGDDGFASVTRPATIRRRGDMAENVGDVPAYAPGQCLLPGEICTIAQEWVNEQRV